MPESSVELGYPAGHAVGGVEGVASVPDALQRTARRFPDGVAFRTVEDRIRLTWSQVVACVERWAAALSGVGVRHGETGAIMMVNCPQHLIVDLAITHLGAAATSIYLTMPPEELAYVVTDAGAKVLVTQSRFLPQVHEAVVTHGLQLETVVVLDAGDPEAIPGVAVFSDAAFLEHAPATGFDFAASWQAVEREDICQVIYTSGTTGRPKGVELSHRSALAGAEVYRLVAPMEPGRRLLSAFPLAHAAERCNTYYLPVVQGHAVTFCPDIRELSDYYVKVHPAVAFMTPRSMERFKATIEQNVEREPDERERERMRRAIRLGIDSFTAEQNGQEISEQVRREWHDTMEVRKRLLATVGLDAFEYAGVGSAPLTLELMAFFIGLGVPAREGYGLTESGATTALGRLDQPYRLGYAGPASPGMEIKIADDGEILVRGNGLMTRYRNNPEATAAAIDADGWLHSGDIGALNELGQLRMIDRKKELIINSNGKNMSPVKIESKVKLAGSFIGQVMAVGDARPYVTALILLDPEAVDGFRRRHGIPDGTPLHALTDDLRLHHEIQAQIDRANAELADVERIRDWMLVPDEWAPGGEELTPTMKLKRRAIINKYAEQIDGLYQAERVGR